MQISLEISLPTLGAIFVTVWLPSHKVKEAERSLKGSSLPQQVNAIQKADVLRSLYSQVSFAVQRMKRKLLASPKSVCAVSARTLALAPAWHRFTQTHVCIFVSPSCPPTELLAPQYQLTPRSSQFPQIWHILMLPGWWCEFSFRATGKFVHTLTDQTLNTNIYGPWLFITES